VPVSAEGCKGEPFEVIVTVNPAPVVADQTATVNSRSSIGVTLAPATATGSIPILNYRITGIDTNGSTPGLSNRVIGNVIGSNGIINDTFINKTSSDVDVIYTIVPISKEGGCEGSPFTVTVTINPEPVVDPQTEIVCSDEAIGVTLNPSTSTSVAVAKYVIKDINSNGLSATPGVTNPNTAKDDEITSGVLLNDSYSNNSNNPVDVVYTIVPVSSDGVEGAAFTLIVTVNPKPIVADQEIEVCSGDVLGIDFNASNTIAVASYSITEILINGTTNITSINTIAGFSVNSGTPRQGTGLSVNEISNDSFINETAVPVDVVYTVVPESAEGCEGAPFTVTVTINPAPVVTDITNIVNSGSPIEVDLVDDPAISGYIIDDININGLAAGFNNSSINDVILFDGISNDSYTNLSSSVVDVIYTITPVSDLYCKGEAFTVRVTIKPGPVVADQAVTVCSDEPIGVTLNPSTNGVFVDKYLVKQINSIGLTATPGVTNPNTAKDDVIASNGVIYNAYTNNSNSPVDVVYTIVPISIQGVKGEEFILTVRVNPAPKVADQVIEVCSGEEVGVNFNASTSIAAATYNITALNLNGLTVLSGNPAVSPGLLASDLSNDSFINEMNAPFNVVYTVVPVSAEDCAGAPFTVTVTVNPAPVVPDITNIVNSGSPIEVDLVDDPSRSGYIIDDININGLAAGFNTSSINDVILCDG
jgi:hypothetical protein